MCGGYKCKWEKAPEAENSFVISGEGDPQSRSAAKQTTRIRQVALISSEEAQKVLYSSPEPTQKQLESESLVPIRNDSSDLANNVGGMDTEWVSATGFLSREKTAFLVFDLKTESDESVLRRLKDD
ncbi:hypothetical protein L596_011077 [Steinernema carpocapsae]|uniref:Uncharacterized protein n=1 Tax=Steinernema carpocapsae TaxID=34508 RepID=A0A4U5NTP1_STECR|nr:hypothetical protein L596_011077 [Steinernema carpocapsae]